MAKDWIEFWGEVQELDARTKTKDNSFGEQIWSLFREVARLSPYLSEQPESTSFFLDRFEKAPAIWKFVFALSMTNALANLDWPFTPESIRPRLISGIDHVLHASDPNTKNAFPVLLGVHEDDLFSMGRSVLKSARDLLSTPCRWDQIHSVARLCNLGHSACIRSYRKALREQGEAARQGALMDARMRYVVAYEHYAIAAREMNKAYGAVLFEGLEAQLESAED